VSPVLQKKSNIFAIGFQERRCLSLPPLTACSSYSESEVVIGSILSTRQISGKSASIQQRLPLLVGAVHMKTIAALTITVVCLALPARPQTRAEGSKQSSNSCLQTGLCSYEPYGEIEKKYYDDGPWKDVTVRETEKACDSAGNKCLLIYPTNIGANGFKHPIVAYGNGTNANPIESVNRPGFAGGPNS
jgi:hypothetical protein